MTRPLAAALLALVLLTPGVASPAHAQSPPQTQSLSAEEIESLRQEKNWLVLYHYCSRYAFDVLAGGLIGGTAGAILRGGPVATITGSVLGSLLGILWFLDSYAGEMIDKHGW